MPEFRDLKGQTFSRLQVMELVTRTGGARWHCICQCDTKTIVLARYLIKGNVTSCGCRGREVAEEFSARRKKHGESTKHSAEYNSWSMMLQRCNNPHYTHYSYYGGRGIKVCSRWHCYENFLADMGRRPSPQHSLDRYPANNGNYEPGNCRWATKSQQTSNRRKPRYGPTLKSGHFISHTMRLKRSSLEVA